MGSPKSGSLLFLTQRSWSGTVTSFRLRKSSKKKYWARSPRDREHRNTETPGAPPPWDQRRMQREASLLSSAVTGQGLCGVPCSLYDQSLSIHRYISCRGSLHRQPTDSTSASQKLAGSEGWQDSSTEDKSESPIARKKSWKVFGFFNRGEEGTYDENFK